VGTMCMVDALPGLKKLVLHVRATSTACLFDDILVGVLRDRGKRVMTPC
jgi:hypothetical protein